MNAITLLQLDGPIERRVLSENVVIIRTARRRRTVFGMRPMELAVRCVACLVLGAIAGAVIPTIASLLGWS